MKKKHRPEIDYTGWTKEQHIAHLKTEPAYQKVYEKIDSTDIEEFIEEYATLKVDLYEKKEAYAAEYEQHYTQFLVKADAYIDKILQKKLFNLQCRWRANDIQLPLIYVIDDFDYWQENIRSCPFIVPITEKEIDICISFLKEDIDWDDNEYNGVYWQNYDGIQHKLKYDSYTKEERVVYGMGQACNEDDFPRLYAFFDKHQNTADLLHLPDLRGPVEQMYMEKSDEIAGAEQIETLRKEGKLEEMMDFDSNGLSKTMEYYLSVRKLKWAKFVERTEDQQTKELFKQSEYVNRKDKRSIYFERTTVHSRKNDPMVYFKFLQEFDEIPPIEAQAGDNWRIALERTARKFQQQKIAEMLPYAYETYLLEFDTFDNIPQLIADRVARYKYDIESKEYKEMIENREFILDGREALTDKRDFDYL
jgi:hypothetical protein